jgi:uncharacterized membrane protein YqhA
VQEFYHHQLRSGITELPRIFGMTASPIKSKGIQAKRKILLISCFSLLIYHCRLFSHAQFHFSSLLFFNTAANSESTLSKSIRELMTLMHSKVVFIFFLSMYNFFLLFICIYCVQWRYFIPLSSL